MKYVFKEIESMEVKEDSRQSTVYDIELEKNSYFTANSIVSHNCRLISDTDIMDVAAHSNSFGGGGSVSIGSHRVITTNFTRLAYKATTLNEFYDLLEKRIDDTAKILKAHKQLILFLQQKDLQPFISQGWIRLDRMFSTFGVLGIVECVEILKNKFDITEGDLLEDILVFYNENVAKMQEKYDILPNIEQIPGESMMLRLPKTDKLIFREEATYDIYANQFIPLWETSSSIFERIEMDGKYNRLYTGGGIVHINVGETLTSKQNEELIIRAVKAGCEHFTTTSTMSLCKNKHRSIGDFNTCPRCQESIIEKRARTVGFWTNLADWRTAKKELDHDKRKVYTKINLS